MNSISAWRTSLPQSASTPPQNALAVLFGSIICISVLRYVIHHLSHQYSFWVYGESLSWSAAIRSPQTLSIESLHGLEGKALFIALDFIRSQKGNEPTSFKLHEQRPLPLIRCNIALFGRGPNGDTFITSKQVSNVDIDDPQATEVNGGPFLQEGEGATENIVEVELPVTSLHDEYSLSLTIEPMGGVFEEPDGIEVRMKLIAKLRADNLRHYREVRIQPAHVSLSN